MVNAPVIAELELHPPGKLHVLSAGSLDRRAEAQFGLNEGNVRHGKQQYQPSAAAASSSKQQLQQLQQLPQSPQSPQPAASSQQPTSAFYCS